MIVEKVSQSYYKNRKTKSDLYLETLDDDCKDADQSVEFYYKYTLDSYLENYKILDAKYLRYSFMDVSYRLPKEFKNLLTTIKEAEQILSLEPNWDQNNGEIVTSDTFISTIKFLFDYSTTVYRTYGMIIDIPKIYPSLKGSIDIDWEEKNYGLLVNVSKGGEVATFYADNLERQKTNGIFNPKEFTLSLLPLAITL